MAVIFWCLFEFDLSLIILIATEPGLTSRESHWTLMKQMYHRFIVGVFFQVDSALLELRVLFYSRTMRWFCLSWSKTVVSRKLFRVSIAWGKQEEGEECILMKETFDFGSFGVPQ